MAINFLQSLFDPARSASMPFNPASAPVPAPMPQFQGNFQQMTQGVAPPPAREANILQAIGGTPDTPAVQMPAAAPAEPSRKRRSFLDTIGQISDVLARVGGAEALYQPTLDAREDRAREIDLEGMRKQLLDLQIQQGGQSIEQGEQALAAGENELADTMRGRAATALGALAQNPDAGVLWNDIAAQAGLDEQTTAQIGGLIEGGISPQVLAQSLGWAPKPTRQGSQAKEVQIYQMLQERDPEAAQAYLQSLANPDSMNPYQAAQLDIALQRLGLQRDAMNQANDFREREVRLKEEKAAGGVDGATGGQDSNSVASILTDFGVKLTGAEDPIADMIKNSTSGLVEYGASMIPGAFGVSTEGMDQIAKLKTVDNAIVLALAGGKLGAGVSNADRDFFKEMSGMISDPTTPAPARLEAWGLIKQRLRGIVQRESKKPAPAARPAPQRNSRSSNTSRSSARIVSVQSAAEARELPSGTRFRTPDGRVLVKR